MSHVPPTHLGTAFAETGSFLPGSRRVRRPPEWQDPAPLIIDEVQYAPGIFRHLKTAIDKDRHATGRFILTGSQHFSLMKGVSESLAGRIGLLELETLARNELPLPDGRQATQQRSTILTKQIVRGQFPELWRVPDFPEGDYYAAYLATYLERDVRQILNVTSLRDFERFIRILASRSGNLLNKSDLARDVGVSVKAIGDWLSVLQASGQIAILEPWFTNIAKRVVKTPKVYFRDTGLLCYLLNLSIETLGGSPLLGAVWESYVYAELRKLISFQEAPVGLWFYRDQRGREIDFVLDIGGALNFVEVTWLEHPRLDDARTIKAVAQELRDKNGTHRPGRHYVVGNPEDLYSLNSETEALNVDELKRVLAPGSR